VTDSHECHSRSLKEEFANLPYTFFMGSRSALLSSDELTSAVLLVALNLWLRCMTFFVVVRQDHFGRFRVPRPDCRRVTDIALLPITDTNSPTASTARIFGDDGFLGGQ
jgi:hypothetical protein